MVFHVRDLLSYYKTHRNIMQTEKINFVDVEDRDVYNITAPFEDEGQMVIAGRVEKRDSEYSDVVFFTENNGVWEPLEGAQTYALQDPFVTFIKGKLIFGGVEVFPNPEHKEQLFWRTVFYQGENINTLEHLFSGPIGMKDVRLLELPDGTIGVFTRPQGEKGGRGRIGFTVVNDLDGLTEEVLDDAPLINSHFSDDEWGGVNEVYLGDEGKINVLGHIACFDTLDDKHYYPIAFEYNQAANEIVDMKIIATRSDFNVGEAKSPDLVDVLFSGGLLYKENGEVELYVGVSDAEAHKAVLPNPFK